tara:strand:+ start:1154 stop:1402 length:249 start_codon:yes stop_codon:yes gene_type:complete
MVLRNSPKTLPFVARSFPRISRIADCDTPAFLRTAISLSILVTKTSIPKLTPSVAQSKMFSSSSSSFCSISSSNIVSSAIIF